MLLNNLPGKWQQPIFLVLGIYFAGGWGKCARRVHVHTDSGSTGAALLWQLCPGHTPVSVWSRADPFLHPLLPPTFLVRDPDGALHLLIPLLILSITVC